MDFKIGQNVKPKKIVEGGVVIFEEYDAVKALVEVIPTQSQCEIYGFDYRNSTCFSNIKSTEINDYNDINDFIIGTNSGYFNIIGVNNEIKHKCFANSIIGNNNVVSDYTNNTTISGTKGEANYNNSQVLAGNQIADLETRQSTMLLAGVDTASAAWTISYLNNDGATLFNIKDNSIISFTAFVTGVIVGGTGAGNNGDFKSWIERGTVVNRAGTSAISRTRQNIATNGTTSGWNTQADVSSINDLRIKVKGAANKDIKWIIKLEVIEMRTGVDLS
jgi:hypothetical protein